MTENKKGVIAEVLNYLKENPFIEGVSDYEIFERQRIQAHIKLQAFVDDVMQKQAEMESMAARDALLNCLDIDTKLREALRGIE